MGAVGVRVWISRSCICFQSLMGAERGDRGRSLPWYSFSQSNIFLWFRLRCLKNSYFVHFFGLFFSSNMQYKTKREEVNTASEPGTNVTEAPVTAIMTTAVSKVPCRPCPFPSRQGLRCEQARWKVSVLTT